MLDFYQEEQRKQLTLKLFVEVSFQDNTSKKLSLLTEQQLGLLDKLINLELMGELLDSLSLSNQYALNYDEQQGLLAVLLGTGAASETWLPALNFPTTKTSLSDFLVEESFNLPDLFPTNDEQNILALKSVTTLPPKVTFPGSFFSNPQISLDSSFIIEDSPSLVYSQGNGISKLKGKEVLSDLEKLGQKKEAAKITESQKKEERMIRNRLSAQKSRARKKELKANLEGEFERLTKENETLKTEVLELQVKNQTLKQNLEEEFNMLKTILASIEDRSLQGEPISSQERLLREQIMALLLLSTNAAPITQEELGERPVSSW